MDTDYYGTVGALYFGALKNGEPFLIDALDLDSGIKPDKEYEFKYIASEPGNYRFYLFRGSTEPIIIEWIYISKNLKICCRVIIKNSMSIKKINILFFAC